MEAVADGAGMGQSRVLQTCVSFLQHCKGAEFWLLPGRKELLPLRSRLVFLLKVVEMFLQFFGEGTIGHRAVVNN